MPTGSFLYAVALSILIGSCVFAVLHRGYSDTGGQRLAMAVMSFGALAEIAREVGVSPTANGVGAIVGGMALFCVATIYKNVSDSAWKGPERRRTRIF